MSFEDNCAKDIDVPRGVVDRRRWLMMQPCTLDGCEAKITGARNDFATVSVRTNFKNWYSVEFAWPTIERIISRGGEFHS